MMEINKRLNLVIPIERADGTMVYAYSIPIAKTIFERYYMVFAKAFSVIYGGGLGIMVGPRVAAMVLRDAAKDLGVWDGPEGAEHGLVNEIHRLTYVVVLTERGWETIPFQEAIAKKLIDEEDVGEVDNAISFFTLASHMHRKKDKVGIMEGAVKLWGGHLESLSYTEFCAYLPTSTEAAISRTSQPHLNSGTQITESMVNPHKTDLGTIQIPT
jgi:hypothetical protein